MKTVTAHEAERQFDQLLDDVASGESITITKQGVPVAWLIPPDEQSRLDAIMAWQEWIAYRKEHNITLGDDVTIKELIEEGRRY